MSLLAFIETLNTFPESVTFEKTMSLIESKYNFTETEFSNGDVNNAVGQNNGSCKIFAFARLNELTEQQTLQCFGDYYRVDVLGNPDGDDHQNIRNFMVHGWPGVRFEGDALVVK